MHDFLAFFLIQVLLLAVILSVHTYLGLHIIRRGLIFSDLALDQLAAFGVIVGIGIGLEGGTTGSYIVSFLATFLGAVLLAVVKPKSKHIPREAVIGIIYCLALVACLMVSDKMTGGMSYLTQTLSGSLLWVTWSLVLVTVAAYILLSVFHYKYREKIIGITDKKNVEHENFWDFMFFLTQGIITVLIVPIAGVLLAYSFLMIPAAIGVLFTRGWSQGLLIGWTTGFVASLTGLLFSYFFRLPYGPCLVLALGAFFFGALILRILLPEKV